MTKRRTDKQEETITFYQDKLKKISASYRNVFNTIDGKVVLEHLESIFDQDDIMGEDPYKTAQNIGRRDVVRHVHAMIEWTEKQDG